MKKEQECGDLSRRLVGGGECGACEARAVREGGARAWRLAGGTCALLLCSWLVVLTLLRLQTTRELHDTRERLARLQDTVDQLREWQHTQRDLLTDINTYDDDVLTELDTSNELQDGLDPEDEDLYDEDGEDDFYSHYDHHDKDGTSGMVRLSPEDMLGRVRTRPSAAPAPAPLSKLVEVRRLLQRTPHTDAQHDTQEPKISVQRSSSERRRRSVRDEAVAQYSAPDYTPHHSWYGIDKSVESTPPVPEPARRARYSRQESGEHRSDFIAAHFHGNTSHMTTQTHPHYKGNGLVRVPHDSAHSVWYPADWTRQSPHPAAPALTRRGHLRVRHSAIYFVYVQIYYLDAHDTSGWVLHRVRGGGDEREALLQCTASAPAATHPASADAAEPPRDKPNSCYSAAALRLRRGDSLAVRNTAGDRHSLMQPEKSFIGLVKLADVDSLHDDDY